MKISLVRHGACSASGVSSIQSCNDACKLYDNMLVILKSADCFMPTRVFICFHPRMLAVDPCST